MVMITFVLRARVQRGLTPPPLPTLVSILISEATSSVDANMLGSSLPDDLPGDDEGVDGFWGDGILNLPPP